MWFCGSPAVTSEPGGGVVRWFLYPQIPTVGWAQALSVQMVTRPGGGSGPGRGWGGPEPKDTFPGASIREVALMEWVVLAWDMPASGVRGRGGGAKE